MLFFVYPYGRLNTANIYADVLKSTKAKVADLIALKLA